MRPNGKILVYVMVPAWVFLSQPSYASGVPPKGAVPSRKIIRVRMKFVANKLFRKHFMAHDRRRGLNRKNSLTERIKRYQLLFKPYTFYKKKQSRPQKDTYRVIPKLRRNKQNITPGNPVDL